MEAGVAPVVRPHASLGQVRLLLFCGCFGFGVLLQVSLPLLGGLQREFTINHQAASLVIALFLAPMRKSFVLAAFTIYSLGSLRVSWLAMTDAVLVLVPLTTWMGVGCSMFFPAALTIPAEIAPNQVGAAYGLFFTAQVAGMSADPLSLGQVLDIAIAKAAFLTVRALTASGLMVALTISSH